MNDHKTQYDSLEAMLTAGQAAYDEGRRHYTDDSIESGAGWIGRHFTSWQDFRANDNLSWPVGQKIVEEMIQKLSGIELPSLKVTKRRNIQGNRPIK